LYNQLHAESLEIPETIAGRRGRDHMVVGFITIYAMSAYY